MATFATYTLGCKVSQYESTALAEELIRLGLSEVDFSDFADAYIINTCTVTAESDAKSRKYIRRALRKNPGAVIAVMGCYSQRSPHEVAAIDGVSIVAGTADKMKLAPMIVELLSKKASHSGRGGTEGDEEKKASHSGRGGTEGDGEGRTKAGQYSSGGDGYMPSPVGSESLPLRGKGDRFAVDEVSLWKLEETVSLPAHTPIIITKSLDGEKFEPMTITRPERTRAYVKIADGCECRCTYCAIADARGPVRSKPVTDVISEVEGLYKNGTKEIVLTGIETGSYGADFTEKYDLGDLIAELDKRGSCERIRLGSLAPELIGEKFIAKVGKTKILAPHFHLSMQSGSDSVLRRMKRRYNTEMALRNISIIRDAFPDATFTTDLMVGFPGETEEDFLDTMNFVSKARFLDCHVFAYSRRDGTPAATYPDQVPEDVKKKRSEMLIEAKNKVRDSVLSEICDRGEPLSCIFENKRRGFWISHSDTFVEVRVESELDLSGKLVSVVPREVSDGVIYGKLL